MSSLIFLIEENQVFIATDTLATTYNGVPFKYTTKAFALPHVRMVICGTGMGGFLGQWFNQINDNMVIKGIDNLNNHAPQSIRNLWERFKNDEISTLHLTTTVYHFGVSENDEVMRAFAYRSANDFVSEEIGYGIGVKPGCELPQNIEFPDDVIRIMVNQRDLQSLKPKEERVYIGGEVIIHQLTKKGIIIGFYEKFSDFNETEDLIFTNLRKINS